MKDIYKPYLNRQSEPLNLRSDDFMYTRITGQHQRWPTDGLKNLGKKPDTRRREIVTSLLGILIVLMGLAAWTLIVAAFQN